MVPSTSPGLTPPPELEHFKAYQPIESEEDIFRALGMDYIPPNQRAAFAQEKTGIPPPSIIVQEHELSVPQQVALDQPSNLESEIQL